MSEAGKFRQKFSAEFSDKQKKKRSNLSLFLLGACVVFSPGFAYSQIVISEFLYDAPGTDADQEFVELFNAGSSPVDLAKWKINDGSNHVLNAPPKNGSTGSLLLSPGSYLLLVDDATAFISLHPAVAVSIIDTVLSLPNTSGTISLLDEEETVVDSISYHKDLGAAGDGNSLKRVSISGTTFAAGSATPGTGSGTSGQSSANVATTSQSQVIDDTRSERSTDNSFVAPPEVQLFADGGPDRVVIVGADVEFIGRAYNRKKELVNHARLFWNFGDGSTAEGSTVFHNFTYPGRYVVVLDIAESENPASDQIIITAEKAQLTFSVLPDGAVAIENHSNRTLDLSKWLIRDLAKIFTLPENSRLLAGATMHIAPRTLGFTGSTQTEFAYPNGIVVLRAGESTEPDMTLLKEETPSASPGVIASTVPAPEMSERDEMQPTAARAAETKDAEIPEKDNSSEKAAEATSTFVATAAAASPGYPWWLGAIAIATVGAGALFVAQRIKRREWEIIEEKEE